MPTRRAYTYTKQYLLRSNISTLLVLTLLFLYTSWLYRFLKHRADLERHLPNQLHGSSHAFTTTSSVQAAAAGVATGRLVGSQLTHAVQAGSLFSWGLDEAHRTGRLGGDSTVPQLVLPHLQVVSVAASRHSLLLTADGVLFSMGPKNSAGGGGHGSKPLHASGQLGRQGGTIPAAIVMPDSALERSAAAAGSASHAIGVDPAVDAGKVKQQAPTGCLQVASGRYHSVTVTADGGVITWGLNDWGQLGREVPVSSAELTAEMAAGNAHRRSLQQQQQQQPGSSTTSSSASAATTGAPPTANRISSNATSSSSCSSGWSCHSGTPGRITALDGVRAVAAAAGRYSTMVLDDLGQIWVWGCDGCAAGQLPLQGEAWRPRKVAGALANKKVVAFDVGYTFWLAATADGELYTCDNMDDGYAGTLPQKWRPNHAGQLGRAGTPNQPGRVDSLTSKRITAVAAGREHALVATFEGQVFSFGGSRAVLGREGDHGLPGLVAGALAGKHVLHVAAGEYYSLAATDSQVFAWGSNPQSQLGNGNSSVKELLQPTAVAGPLGSGEWQIRGLAAGYQHAFAIADKPGDAQLQKLRQDGKAAAGMLAGSAAGGGGSLQPGVGASGVAGIEVVLTEKQQQEREQQQKQQQQQGDSSVLHKGAAAVPQASPAGSSSSSSSNGSDAVVPASPSTPTAAAANVKTVTLAGRGVAAAAPITQHLIQQPSELHHAAAATSTTSSSSSSSAACSTPDRLPAEWHSNYLPIGSPNLPLPRDAWAAWTPSPWHNQLAELSPDVFELLPKRYNAEHKNPCWGGLGPGLSCLPYFNIIGVSKCGTTDLYHRLTLHKQILASTNKGPHFWDECPYPPAKGGCTAGPSGDFQAYINLFSRAADLIRSRPDAITGEASSNTFTSANGVYLRGFRGDKPWKDWAGTAGVNASMPAMLREAQPYLRLIVMLRDPVDRYYSAYHYYRWWEKDQRQPTADEFHAHAVREMQQWRDCVAASDLATYVRRYQPQQLVKGMYAQFLQDWLAHFPRHQLLLLRYEDYKAALPQHLEAVLRFLDVPQPDTATWQAMLDAAVQNTKAYPAMRPDTRQLLRDFYQPFNTELSQALSGDCRWLWQDVVGRTEGAGALAAASGAGPAA